MNRILLGLLLCGLLLAACDSNGTPTPPTTPSAVPTFPPTDEAPVEELTEEAFDPTITEADLIDSSEIPGGQIDLRYSGQVEGRIPPNSTIPTVELLYMPDSTPPHYFLSISSGEIIQEIGGIQLEFRADLEPGTYPIAAGLLVEESAEKPVIARIMGRDGSIYDRFMQGFYRLDSVGDTMSGSFAFSGGDFDLDFIKVIGAFNSLTPVTASN